MANRIKSIIYNGLKYKLGGNIKEQEPVSLAEYATISSVGTKLAAITPECSWDESRIIALEAAVQALQAKVDNASSGGSGISPDDYETIEGYDNAYLVEGSDGIKIKIWAGGNFITTNTITDGQSIIRVPSGNLTNYSIRLVFNETNTYYDNIKITNISGQKILADRFTFYRINNVDASLMNTEATEGSDYGSWAFHWASGNADLSGLKQLSMNCYFYDCNLGYLIMHPEVDSVGNNSLSLRVSSYIKCSTAFKESFISKFGTHASDSVGGPNDETFWRLYDYEG